MPKRKTVTEKRIGIRKGTDIWVTAPGTDVAEARELRRDTQERVVLLTIREVPNAD